MAVLGAGMLALAGAWLYRAPVPAGAAAAAVPAAAASSAVSVVDGLTVVRLAPEVQRRSGLATQTVGAGVPPGGAIAYGTVMDLRPLIDWRGRYEAALAQAAGASAQVGAAAAELARDRKLYDDGQNVSLKAVQVAQASARQASAAADAARALLKALHAEAAQRFGSVVSRWAVQGGTPLDRLFSRRAALVRAALPPGLAQPPRTVEVALDDAAAHRATWVSAAAQADPRLGASLQLYETDGGWPAGASVMVRLIGPAAASPGTFVPRDAVVWYAGQPWAYVQRDRSHFARVPLLGAAETADGYVAAVGIAAGTQVVIRGAGLLLSQEQIPPPGGTGCKDPECDD